MAGKLSALKVKNLTAAGRYGDGGGLWLQVRDAEHRSWLFRYRFGGRPRMFGLGPVVDVSLAEAREAAQAARKQVQAGIDPIEQRRTEQRALREREQTMTFEQVAERYLAAHESSWRNEKHRWQWRATLAEHAFPVVGSRPVASIGTADVMRILEPIWRTTPETAARLRGRIERLLDFAKAREWRTGENPARWRGHIQNMLPARNKARSVVHHPALPWREIGAFVSTLDGETGVTVLALKFTIFTAARTGETIGARWSEIDLFEKTWTVPKERMKAAKEHRVPLSSAALDVLKVAAELRDHRAPDGFVFPGSRAGKPLSDMTMIMLLRRIGRGDLTVHGFRSSFRDWAAETTAYPREVAEAALAHVLADKVEAAYRRGDLFEKRRRLMQDWADFCLRIEPAAGEVVAIRAAS